MLAKNDFSGKVSKYTDRFSGTVWSEYCSDCSDLKALCVDIFVTVIIVIYYALFKVFL